MFCFQGESPPNNIRIDSLLHLMYQKYDSHNGWLSTYLGGLCIDCGKCVQFYPQAIYRNMLSKNFMKTPQRGERN